MGPEEMAQLMSMPDPPLQVSASSELSEETIYLGN